MVLDRLRAEILSGALALESQLAMKKLRERYSVDRSPIREAHHRLLGEGIVQFIGG